MRNDPANQALREQLVAAIGGHQAHIDFEQAIDQFQPEERGIRIAGFPHSAWELLEHMRIAQSDILEFSRNAQHQSPKWPDEYWPSSATPPNRDAWENSKHVFLADRRAFEALICDPDHDLLASFPHGTGQNLLREALLIASHNSYHLGQIVTLYRAMESE